MHFILYCFMKEDLTIAQKEFDKKFIELSKNNKKGILIGAVIFEKAEKSIIEGDSSALEKLAGEWKLKGGKIELNYNPRDKFKTAQLYRKEIYKGIEFYISDNIGLEKKQEEIKDKTTQKNQNLYAGVFITVNLD
jgi:hypothetical protein